MDRYTEILNEWRIAYAAARAAEDALLASTFTAVEKGTHPPPIQQLEHAKQLRNAANELLKAAIAELRAQSIPPTKRSGDE